MLLLGLLDLLLRLPYFESLLGLPSIATTSRTGRRWGTLLIGALLPAVTLFPFFQLGSIILPASRLLPQAFTNEILVWAILNAALIAALSLIPGGARPQFNAGAAKDSVALDFAVRGRRPADVRAPGPFFRSPWRRSHARRKHDWRP